MVDIIISAVTPSLSPVLGLLQEESTEQCGLLMPPSEELPDRPHQPQSLPALPAAEMSGSGHVKGRYVPPSTRGEGTDTLSRQDNT